MIPHGNYPTLNALTVGLLNREKPDWSRWLSTLEQHLQRPEEPAVWKAMRRVLMSVMNAGEKRGLAFLA